MTKSIIVAGYGPGISDAVARKFGKEGYGVAVAARNAERLEKGVESLLKAGIEARAFTTDVGEPGAARALVRKASAALGPVAVLHWNAYAAGQAQGSHYGPRRAAHRARRGRAWFAGRSAGGLA